MSAQRRAPAPEKSITAAAAAAAAAAPNAAAADNDNDVDDYEPAAAFRPLSRSLLAFDGFLLVSVRP